MGHSDSPMVSQGLSGSLRFSQVLSGSLRVSQDLSGSLRISQGLLGSLRFSQGLSGSLKVLRISKGTSWISSSSQDLFSECYFNWKKCMDIFDRYCYTVAILCVPDDDDFACRNL